MSPNLDFTLLARCSSADFALPGRRSLADGTSSAKTLVDAFPVCGLGVPVATDDIFYQTDVIARPRLRVFFVIARLRTRLHVVFRVVARLQRAAEGEGWWEGGDEATIKLLYTFPQSVGIAGGRPSSSYYFVGAPGDGPFSLDPHHSRPSVPLRLFLGEPLVFAHRRPSSSSTTSSRPDDAFPSVPRCTPAVDQ
ncbi:hypothetical protein B0H16DRAFT_1724203 [Mycena metata]|uniref:Cysteine protease n=1 Tax=Mycena metata TaxID=1033252 RepID=A0AAD7IXZ0_9AGAR|nr:hypothetical protein B0H16DRAFT_1724203 [Mycena metata]